MGPCNRVDKFYAWLDVSYCRFFAENKLFFESCLKGLSLKKCTFYSKSIMSDDHCGHNLLK